MGLALSPSSAWRAGTTSRSSLQTTRRPAPACLNAGATERGVRPGRLDPVSHPIFVVIINHRGGGIRTRDLSAPSRARYQATPHPVVARRVRAGPTTETDPAMPRRSGGDRVNESRLLCQLSYTPRVRVGIALENGGSRPRTYDLPIMGAAGIEPATFGLRVRCSSQLSYAPMVSGFPGRMKRVDREGLEPPTFRTSSGRSPN